jgi:perosamine synthetase
MRQVYVGDFRLGAEERRVINEVLDSGRISEGVRTAQFEQTWARYVGTRFAVATSSGTAALIAGWHAYRVRRALPTVRRKVITAPITYIATANALTLTGYEPVFVDIDPVTFGITPATIGEHLATALDPDAYAAINPVHLMGYCCDMDGIRNIAGEYGLDIVEDSAQAHGSVYRGRRAGTMSFFSVFSFYIAHNIQAGEMGALNTDDEELFRLVRSVKTNGRMCDCAVCTRSEGICPHAAMDEEDRDPRFTHTMVGYNFKTMEFQAALAVSQIAKADEIFRSRQRNVRMLHKRLSRHEDLLQLPLINDDVSYLAFPVVIRDSRAVSRKLLRERLAEQGVESRPLFGCIPTQQPAFAHLRSLYEGRLPVAEHVGRNGFYIGCHQYLTDDDIAQVGEAFDRALSRK